MTGPAVPAATWRTYGELLLVTLIWGGGVVAIKVAGHGFGSVTAATMRTGLASALYLPLLLAGPSRQRLPRIRDLGWFFALGFLGFFAFNLFYFAGLQRTTAVHGALIWGVNPVATAAAAALLLRERLPRLAVIGVIISTLGVGAIVLSSTHTATAHGASVTGDLLLVGEVLAWVGYTLVARLAMRRFSPMMTTGYACIMGFLLFLPAAWLSGSRFSDLQGVPSRAWIAIFYSGCVSVVFSYILWNRALLRLGPTRTAVFGNLTPLWGLGLAHLIEDEALSVIHGLAAVVIIGGVILANRPPPQVAPDARTRRAVI